jgi:hypothetical protein
MLAAKPGGGGVNGGFHCGLVGHIEQPEADLMALAAGSAANALPSSSGMTQARPVGSARNEKADQIGIGDVLGSFVTDLIHAPPCDILVARG